MIDKNIIPFPWTILQPTLWVVVYIITLMLFQPKLKKILRQALNQEGLYLMIYLVFATLNQLTLI